MILKSKKMKRFHRDSNSFHILNEMFQMLKALTKTVFFSFSFFFFFFTCMQYSSRSTYSKFWGKHQVNGNLNFLSLNWNLKSFISLKLNYMYYYSAENVRNGHVKIFLSGIRFLLWNMLETSRPCLEKLHEVKVRVL